VVSPRTEKILVIDADPQERMRLVRRFLKEGFEVDAYGLWHDSLVDEIEASDVVVVDSRSYAQVVLATVEMAEPSVPPDCVIIADNQAIATRLRRALKARVFVRPVDEEELCDALSNRVRAEHQARGTQTLGRPFEEAALAWASGENTLTVSGSWRTDSATIFIQRGQIVHAECGLDAGPPAIARILAWPEHERTFWIEDNSRSPEKQTLYGTTSQTLARGLEQANDLHRYIQRYGGLESIWSFDWKAFHEHEDQVSFRVDQLLPWLEGTGYLWQKVFVAEGEIHTALAAVMELVDAGVLRSRDGEEHVLKPSARALKATSDRWSQNENLGGGDAFDSPTVAEEEVPRAGQTEPFLAFSDEEEESAVAPLIEAREGMAARTARLSAQIAAFEAERRAMSSASGGSPRYENATRRSREGGGTQPSDGSELTGRERRLFWRQVAYEQHARAELSEMEKKRRKLGGSEVKATTDSQVSASYEELGKDSGLFAIASEATALFDELKRDSSHMRDADDSSATPRHSGTDKFGYSQRAVSNDMGEPGGESGWRTETEPRSRPSGDFQGVVDREMDSEPSDDVAAVADVVEATLSSEQLDAREQKQPATSTAPRSRPSGDYVAQENGEDEAAEGRTSTEPRSRPSGDYRQIEGVAETPGVATDDDFLTTRVPDTGQREPVEGEPRNRRHRRGGLRVETGESANVGEEAVLDEELSDADFFSNDYDDALDLALEELFEESGAGGEFDEQLFTDDVVVTPSSSDRREVSDRWLPPQPSDAGRPSSNTEQQPVALATEKLREATNGDFSAAIEEAQRQASSASPPAPPRVDKGDATEQGPGSNNTLLLSAVSAPNELRDYAEEPSEASGRLDELEEEDTPVAGVERVSEAVLGKSGFGLSRKDDEAGDDAEDTDEFRDEDTDKRRREPQVLRDETVDISDELDELTGQHSDVRKPATTRQSSPKGSGIKDLSRYEPRLFIWAIATLMLLAAIILLVMNDDSTSSESQRVEVPAQTEQRGASGLRFVDNQRAASMSRTISEAEFLRGVAYGGEAGKDIERRAMRIVQETPEQR
jgi:hypothetical protein